MIGSRKGGGQEGQRWLGAPATAAEAELRLALDEAASRDADEVALRRVWSRMAEMPELVPSVEQDPAYARLRGGSHESLIQKDRTRRPWIVAASLAGATVTLAFLLLETKSEMRNARVAKPAPAVASGGVVGKREIVDQRSVLVAPATVRTAAGETLHLSLRGGTDVVVKSESALVLDENDRPAVSAGEVQFHVPPQPPGRIFTVTAGVYRVVVVGTRFRVNMHNLDAAVKVDEGVVEVWTDRRIARVTAGETWSSPTTASTAPSPSTSSASAEARGETPDSGNNPLRADRKARSSRSSREQLLALSSPVSARASNSSSATSSSPSGLASSSGRPLAGSSADGLLPPATDVGPSVAPIPAAVVSPAPAPFSAPAPVAPAPPTDMATLAVAARAARAAGDSRRALGLYRTLAQKGGPAGENAEYEIGRVLRDGLRQPREAISAWRMYRAQHPRGLLRVEADISVIETLVSIGDRTAAAGEASDFVARYPESERRAEIARLAGDLLRERGDCASAVDAYNVALGGGRGRRGNVADGVSFHRSVCLLRGDQFEGVAALKAYLHSFPSGRFRADAQRLLGGAESRAPTTTIRP